MTTELRLAILADRLIEISNTLEDLERQGYTQEGVLDAIRSYLGGRLPDLGVLATALGGTPPVPLMTRVVERLFAESETLTDAAGNPLENQTPALDCVVMLRGMPSSIRGALSTTPEGAYRMMTPHEDGRQRALIEQFFAPQDMVLIGLIREVRTSAPLIRSA